jgi:hypothetical protein
MQESGMVFRDAMGWVLLVGLGLFLFPFGTIEAIGWLLLRRVAALTPSLRFGYLFLLGSFETTAHLRVALFLDVREA